MRSLLLITFAATFLLSCNKNIETENANYSYINNVKAGLKDSLSVIDYTNLDFDQLIITKTENGRSLFRIPLTGKNYLKNLCC